ncbi:MAG: hypothetical protein JMDDDDMK_01367 [Acidobacteria bacterium]|nr:hypothetical protein [Acidobacteriota bacterium]
MRRRAVAKLVLQLRRQRGIVDGQKRQLALRLQPGDDGAQSAFVGFPPQFRRVATMIQIERREFLLVAVAQIEPLEHIAVSRARSGRLRGQSRVDLEIIERCLRLRRLLIAQIDDARFSGFAHRQVECLAAHPRQLLLVAGQPRAQQPVERIRSHTGFIRRAEFRRSRRQRDQPRVPA